MDLNFITDLINSLSSLMKTYLNEIVLSMVATLLVIYGNDILSFVKKQIGSLRIFLRISLFVAFCAFGFAFLTSFLTPLMSQTIGQVDKLWLPFIVIISYYLIGLAAQKKGMI
ncbi:DUF3392 family protein [Thiomicrorhabdus arctica]|uniref:DUF3392 family protein n=1 Tax=Thiomicrorhabdus arctica TaxID=131540 RepID=UPI00036A93C1|nr:DUF3392 family protein [Thiomicrorhabdus arctica]